MYVIYSMLVALGLVLGFPYWLFEMLWHRKYRRGFSERFGRVPARFRNSRRRRIWVHAVSVGEVLAVSRLVDSLRAEFPQHEVVVSTTTDTGQKLAAKRFGADQVFYFPFDFAFAVRRWLAALEPDLVVVAETEFWPNFLRAAERAGTPVVVVNARISDRSLPGYLRWRGLLKPVLRAVNLFLAQTAEDARRLRLIGAPEDRVVVAGNLKYDASPPARLAITDELSSALARSGAGPVLVCGSTVEGEEALLLEAFACVLEKFPSAMMLLAPRHPERFEQVERLLEQSKIRFSRRSAWKADALKGGVLLVDSIGELASLYALADLAFVGGSLVPRGGHNILEPAQSGVAILVGEHTENFRDIIALFHGRDALRVVCSRDLSSTILELLSNGRERRDLGRRAAETLAAERGATRLTIEKLRVFVGQSMREVPA
jgi:3-deoxy-D-manno-octulosonic-acid transferase